MQAMTGVSVRNLKGFTLGNLTPLKSQSSTYSPSGKYRLITWKQMVSGLSDLVTLVFSVYPITSKLDHKL